MPDIGQPAAATIPRRPVLGAARAHLRRAWLPTAFFVLLALPLLTQVLGLGGTDRDENRRLAPPPAVPTSFQDALNVPKQTDAWLTDHFGLRTQMVRASNWLRWHVFGELSSTRLVAGRHGRIFLAAHDGAAPDSLILQLCGAAVDDAAAARIAADLRLFLARARASGLDPELLIVPTAPRLYPEDLPPRFAAACAGHEPATDRIMALLGRGPDASRLIYPLAAMLAMKADFPVIPRLSFHWEGQAPLRMAEDIAERRWHRPRHPLPRLTKRETADLNYIEPGIGLSNRVTEADPRRGGVQECYEQSCGALGRLPLPALDGLIRYTRPGVPGKLLIIADSFGNAIAPAFTEHFGQVWQLSTNHLPPDAADRAAEMALLRGFGADRVLFVFHDGWLTSGLPARLTGLLFPCTRPDPALACPAAPG